MIELGNIILGAFIGFAITYYIQFRLPQKQQRIDRLRQLLFDYGRVVAKYWTKDWSDKNERAVREVYIIARMREIQTEYSLLSKEYRTFRKNSDEFSAQLSGLIDNATGGCFQCQDWCNSAWRPRAVLHSIAEIVPRIN